MAGAVDPEYLLVVYNGSAVDRTSMRRLVYLSMLIQTVIMQKWQNAPTLNAMQPIVMQ